MDKRKVLGCSVGIGIALVSLFVIGLAAALLEEMGAPHKLLVRIGALLAIGGMAVGYSVSNKIRGIDQTAKAKKA